MKTITKTLLTIFVFAFGTICLYAQENIVTAGGDISSPSGSVSYSIGQVFYATQSGANNSTIEGVQQPFEIMETSIEPNQDISFNATVYPNPATNAVTIEISDSEYSGLTFHLYDVLGKCISDGNITDFKTEVDISNLAPSTYFLKVVHKDKTTTTFKIIKNSNY